MNGFHPIKRRFLTAVHILKNKGVYECVASLIHRCKFIWVSRAFRWAVKPRLQQHLLPLQNTSVCVYVATSDWNYPFLQRQHHIARELSKIIPLVYVSPRQGFDRFFGIRCYQEQFFLTDSLDAVMTILPQATVICLSVDHRLPRLREQLLQYNSRVVYDYIDILDASVDRMTITKKRKSSHEQMLSDSNVQVVASAQALMDDVLVRRKHGVHLITNGVDLSHYQVHLEEGRFSQSYENIVAQGRPLIGYFGALSEWLDYELIIYLAKQRPQYSVVLIGTDYDGSLARFRHLFPENLYVHPPVDYASLPYYAVQFSVSMIPFRINHVTEGASPLKLFEYMALGKPIVSTAIREAKRYRSVLTADSRNEFVVLVDKAVNVRPDDNLLKDMAGEAVENSWTGKAAQMARLISIQSE